MATLLILGAIWGFVSLVFCAAVGWATIRQVPASGDPAQRTILAIDDDANFLSVTKMMLESEGYTVLTATSPKEGIEFFKGHCREIRLVLLDFLMPEMNGDQVFERLHAIDPNIPVLVVTGYMDDLPGKNFDEGVCDYLAKPFRIDDFVTKVRNGVEFCLANQTAIN